MEKELEEKNILAQVSKIADEFNEVINLEETQPQLFFNVKRVANSEGINYTNWLRNHNFFHVDTKRGQTSAKEMKETLISFADEDNIIEKLKTKNVKLMDNVQTRAMFHKISPIEFVKQLTNCTLLLRGINESEVLNIRLKKLSEDKNVVLNKNIVNLPIYYKIKQQAQREKLTINEWFNKYSDFNYMGNLASKSFLPNQLKDKAKEIVIESNPDVYMQNVKKKLQEIATCREITTLADIRKIDKKLANSIRYLQQNYPTGGLDSWYEVIEKLELETLIKPGTSLDANHNVPVKELDRKLDALLELSYPNKIVTNIKNNTKVHYLCKKIASYQHLTVKVVLESKGYEFPLGYNTVKRLKSVNIVNKAKNLTKFNENKNLKKIPHAHELIIDKKK